jgi:ribosome-binding factor A
MVSQQRAQRIARRIQEELAELLIFEVSDPRLQGVFITDVNVDRELAFASVFASAFEGVERKEEIMAGLDHAAGFLRRRLAQQVELRSFPQLRFNWDPTPEHADRIDQLIDSLQKDQEGHGEPE